MIRHCVMLNLRPGHAAGELAGIMDGLAAITRRLDGAEGFVAGPNRDYEDRTPDFDFGFTIDFTTRDALGRYAADPDHRALGTRLKALCTGGADGIAVFDLETPGGTAR